METKQKPTRPTKTKIIVEHTFGEENLLDLLSDYAAEKIRTTLTIENSHHKQAAGLTDKPIHAII